MPTLRHQIKDLRRQRKLESTKKIIEVTTCKTSQILVLNTTVLNSGLVFPAERHSEINGDTLRNTKLTVPTETKFYA